MLASIIITIYILHTEIICTQKKTLEENTLKCLQVVLDRWRHFDWHVLYTFWTMNICYICYVLQGLFSIHIEWTPPCWCP
jgi:hypothetical protein